MALARKLPSVSLPMGTLLAATSPYVVALWSNTRVFDLLFVVPES